MQASSGITWVLSLLTCILAGFVPGFATGQETNYWSQNFGATSTLKGGVEVGGVDNISAVYYNPGALSFIEEDFLEGQADVITADIISMENALGEGLAVDMFLLNASPTLFAYKHRLTSNPNLQLALGALTRYASTVNFAATYETEGDYLEPEATADVFQGLVNYNNRIRENWLTAVVAYRLSEHIGLGLSGNLVLRAQDYDTNYYAVAFPQEELGAPFATFSKLAVSDQTERVVHRSLGFVFKPAVNFRFDRLKMGLTLTTPNLNLGLLNNQAQRKNSSIMPDQPEANIEENEFLSFYKGVYKTPFSASVGGEYTFGKLSLGLAAEWFAPIKEYSLLKADSGSERYTYPTAEDPDYALPLMAHKSVVNLGLSWDYRFNESWKYLGSFRTDFNYFDDGALDRSSEFVPTLTFWDVYHVTSGVVFSGPRASVSMGFNYGHGRSDNNTQLVNMTDARQENRLRGDVDDSLSARYHNISFTLGFNFNINRNTGLRAEED